MRRTSCLTVLALCSAFAGVAVSLGSGGCQASPAITVMRLGPGEQTAAVQGDVVKTRRGGQEAFAGVRGGYYVVRSVEDWRNAWPGGSEPPLPSTLDPARSMLLVGVAENKETVALKITKVLETGDRIHVWVKETRAGENCTAKRERSPFDAVVAPRIDKPVKFYVEDARAESCGEPPAVVVSCRTNDDRKWTPTVIAQPGDTVECEMSAAARGKFALVDNVLSLGELPGGSAAKLSYTKGPARGSFAVDVFGKYVVRAEAADDSGRRTQTDATVDALPPKTKDVLVQLAWTNFDVSDDPDTFPRAKLRAFEETRDARNKPVANECSLDKPRPTLCDQKVRSAYAHMRVWASDKRVPLDVLYVDERIEKGPLVCVQLYFDGVRTGETCDRNHRSAGDRWQVGTVEMETGKLLDDAAANASGDAGAAHDGGTGDAGASGSGIKKPLPPRIPAPKPVPPAPRR